MAEAFEQFAIVELFGHQIIAGKVSEQVIGGQGFVRVDVPVVDGREAFTKFYGAGAIYAITPCDEVTMLQAAIGLQPKPIDPWKLNVRPVLDRPSEEEIEAAAHEDDAGSEVEDGS